MPKRRRAQVDENKDNSANEDEAVAEVKIPMTSRKPTEKAKKSKSKNKNLDDEALPATNEIAVVENVESQPKKPARKPKVVVKKPETKSDKSSASESEEDSESKLKQRKTLRKPTQQPIKKEEVKETNASSETEDNDKSANGSKKKITKKPATKFVNPTGTQLDSIDFSCNKLNGEGKPHNIRICSWNVAGFRAMIKKNGIDYILKEDADIVVLQETKCDRNKLPNEAKIPGYQYYFLDSEKSGYCGMALYSKEEPISISYGLRISEFDIEGRLITAEYPTFFLVTVYVPNAGPKLITLKKRLKWNEAFKTYIKALDARKPVIITGDMNVAHKEIDLKNPKTNTKNAGFTKEERDGMTDFIAQGYVDTFRYFYPDQKDVYTFWSYFANSRSKNIGWRLDYFLVSDRIKQKVCDVVNRSQVFGSDHCPIVMYANL